MCIQRSSSCIPSRNFRLLYTRLNLQASIYGQTNIVGRLIEAKNRAMEFTVYPLNGLL